MQHLLTNTNHTVRKSFVCTLIPSNYCRRKTSTNGSITARHYCTPCLKTKQNCSCQKLTQITWGLNGCTLHNVLTNFVPKINKVGGNSMKFW